MWQICGYIPQTLLSFGQDFTEISAQLSTSFFIETFIHAKEKVINHLIVDKNVLCLSHNNNNGQG